MVIGLCQAIIIDLGQCSEKNFILDMFSDSNTLKKCEGQ